jgi:predicted metal-dependent hydrolase
MSNNYWDEDYDDLFNEDTSSDEGSDLLKKLRKAKRADEKRIKELTEQLDGFNKERRERTVKEVLEKKGVSPKLARLAMRDIEGEITEESIANWVNDYADVFGVTQEMQSVEEMRNRDALRQQDNAVQNAITPDRAEDLSMRMDNAQSMEEFLHILRSE